MADSAAAFGDCEPVDLESERITFARLRLHLEGLSTPRFGGCEALRRDAPADSGVCELGGRSRRRNTGQSPPTNIGQLPLWTHARSQSRVRSANHQILVELPDQTSVFVWNGGAGLPGGFDGVDVAGAILSVLSWSPFKPNAGGDSGDDPLRYGVSIYIDGLACGNGRADLSRVSEQAYLCCSRADQYGGGRRLEDRGWVLLVGRRF